jgi:DNA-directed RNA polymerase subunit RPC12/RpoP
MRIVIGLFIWVLLSFFIAISFFVSGKGFLIPFVISLSIQFILFFIFNAILLLYGQLQINKLKVQRMNAIDKNTATLHCATCGELNSVEININDNNEFVCSRCSSKNKVFVNISNVQKTDILYDTNILTEEELIKNGIIKKNELH